MDLVVALHMVTRGRGCVGGFGWRAAAEVVAGLRYVAGDGRGLRSIQSCADMLLGKTFVA